MSSILSFYAGMLILLNKNLQSHPYKAFAVLMIIDSGNFFQFDLAQDIWRSNEYIDFPNVPILSYSLFQNKEWLENNTYSVLGVLYCSNSITTKLFQYTFYSVNFGLTWDLINSIKNPFDSTESRYKTILITAPTIFLLSFVYWFLHYLFEIKTLFQLNPRCGSFRFEYMFAPGEIAVELSFSLYALYAIFISANGLCRKGLNKEIKKTFIKRQIAFFIIVIFT